MMRMRMRMRMRMMRMGGGEKKKASVFAVNNLDVFVCVKKN